MNIQLAQYFVLGTRIQQTTDRKLGGLQAWVL